MLVFDTKQFKKIDSENFIEIKEFVSNFICYSDFNPLSLLCWNAESQNSFHFVNNNLIIKIQDYLTNNFVYSIIGNNEVENTVELILKTENLLKFVPETTANLTSTKFRKEEDRDSFDYVINLNKFVSHEGGEYKPLRKQLSKFIKKYSEPNIKKIDVKELDIQQQIMFLTKNWCKSKKFTEKETFEQLELIKRYLKFEKYFLTINFGLYIENLLAGFIFDEIVNKEWVMGHFGLANNNIEHSLSYLEYKTAKYLLEDGYKYLNIQQDTGIQGLRESKMIYRPEYFLKKFTITKN